MKKQTIKIGIFCTSTPLTKTKSENDYKFLKSKGIEIFEHPQVRIRDRHMAGSIKNRVIALHEMLKDPSIDILMAYWGGTNTNQILPYLDYDLFKKFPKPIVGFSDTSALLTAVNKISGVTTYMGPAGISFDKPQPFNYSYDYLKRIVFDGENDVEIEDSDVYADDLYFLRSDSDHRIIEQNHGRKVFKEGLADAEVYASNLQTLLVLAGTKFFPNLENKVIFLEEAESEGVSEVHRYLTHLSQVINLNTVAGVCIGKFASQTKFSDVSTEEMLYLDVFGDLNIPIIYNLNFGHTDPMFTIPIGGRVKIDTKNKKIVFYK